MSTVLIAVDGSSSDRSVIRQTLELLGEDHHYVVVSVSDEPAMLGAMSMSYASASVLAVPSLSRFADGMDLDVDAAVDIAEHAKIAAGLTGADAVGEVGDPATVLIRIAIDRKAAVIAMGASERNWFSRLFDPSVEAAVLGRAPCPVLVIHAH